MTRPDEVQALVELSVRRAGKELCFSWLKALQAIKICLDLDIAVLGVEMFNLVGDKLQAKGCSDYIVAEAEWKTFVMANNKLAEEAIRRFPSKETDLYVLTMLSFEEFQELRAAMKQ